MKISDRLGNKKLPPIMLDLEGLALTLEEKEILQNPHVGGIILFSRNYDSSQQIKQLIQEIRQIKSSLLIAVDQEGGRVQRFKNGFTQLPPLAEFGKLYQQNASHAKQIAAESARKMAQELLNVDVDFSFTPVLDINFGVSQVIGDRSFSDDPQIICELAKSFIQGMDDVGMDAIGKHFPGHGAVIEDSHHELPQDDRDFITIWQEDLLPYRELQNQLAGVMTAHIVYPNIDKNPASFSSFWLQEILRKKLKFSGIIFSDDLSMAGAKYAGNFLERARLAIAAGCNMVLVCNNRQGAIQILDGLNYESSYSHS